MMHALLLALLTATSPDGWPQFRGPDGQGHSSATGLPVSWDRERNVAWKRDVPGRGWSSPICHDGAVYLTTAVADRPGEPRSNDGAQSLRALRLDARTGATAWDVELFRAPPRKIHRKNSHASPTPITDGRRLFVHFGTNGTAALGLDGTVLWKTDAIDYDPVHGSGGSPALLRDLLIFSCDGSEDPFVVALDAATGKVRWRTSRPPSSERKLFAFSTPLPVEAGGRTEVVLPGANHLCAYEPSSGRELWRVAYSGGYSVVPRPVAGHGLVFISTGFDSPVLLAVRPGGSGDVSATHVAWREDSSVPLNPSFLLVGDELYAVSDRGMASCLDARTGKRHWRERLDGSFSASPVHAEGRIYFQSEEGEGIVIAAGTEFRLLSRNALEERSLASYAVADGAIFIRTEERLWRIEEGGPRRRE